jgi:hypothetical protein
MIRKYLYLIIISFFFSTAVSHDCVALNPDDYGFCDMVLGVAWTTDGCIYLSGCDWVNQNGEDHSEDFFQSIEECEDECFNHDGILGDLNEDGTINVLDIVLLVNIIINNIIPNNHIQWAADLNLDVLLDVLDIVLLVNVILDASEENRDSWEIISDDIFIPRCASCHTAGSFYAEQSGLVLTSDVAYEEIINTLPTNTSALEDGLIQVSTEGGMLGIQLSYLWEKINIRDEEHYLGDHPYYGEFMPLGGPYLTNGQLSFIEEWILAGAPQSGAVVDPALLADTTIYSAPEFEILEEPEYGLQLHLGPFEVPPGGDMELLSYEDPDLTEDVFINRVKISMRPGSHHFILYTFTEDIPSYFVPEEGVIRPFYDNNGELIYGNLLAMQYHKFVTGTQWPSMDFHFPDGIALRFPHDYGFDMNTHYLNYTDEPLTGEIYTNLYFSEPNEIEHVAEILILNNQNFSLPPNEISTVERIYSFAQIRDSQGLSEDVNEINIFQLFTHAHQHMIRFDVEIGYPDGTIDLVYTALDWEHPPILQLNEHISLTSGMGIRLIATYDNWTDDYLQFGLLSTDEMMILFGYIYTD